MDAVARSTNADRRELFEETAAQRGIGRALIVEKDFWVCWLLKVLFSLSATHPEFVFKGGTSLSKVFNLIGRFSEDVDISIDWRGLGFVGDRDPAAVGSNRRKKLLEELGEACAAYVGQTLAPQLTAAIGAVLSTRATTWGLSVDPTVPQTLLFEYPRCLPSSAYANLSYIRPMVKLEFGARGEQWPASLYPISSYAAEAYPHLFETPSVEVRALEPKRTFWEKATILHAWTCRGSFPDKADGASRHYYDVATLARTDVRASALADLGLLESVAEHKRRFYPAAWARYELARPGTLRLAPDDAMLAGIRADYRAMAEMFIGDVPALDAVLRDISELEAEINGLKA